MKKTIFLSLLICCFLVACDTSKQAKKTNVAPKTTDTAIELPPLVEGQQDSVAISDDLGIPTYRATATRSHDLIHTSLDLKFDWVKEHVIGVAELKLKPYFYESDLLVLDAKNFDITSVTLGKSNEALKYDYDNEQLSIHLNRKYSKNEEYTVVIKYIAKPGERKDIGGSQAITSDKGLYFINARGEDKEKPTQIWTQGETESNSCWFPTIDKPNERCTGEIKLTVPDKFVTLSNGAMVSSIKNTDGSRTDHWKMDQPHAPYLFMIAVGEYAVVKEKWENIELAYYVEPKFQKDAKAIFPNTPEMLSFFSERLGVKYPWNKYSQIIVRDYVSGAMENTTAVIFGEYMQNTERDLIDVETNENVVAHEMFHQWFGDYVTTESWSNLTLNEGFANYSEYLWIEHKYGKDAAQAHWREELNGYIGQSKSRRHPLIHFEYGNREEMFDAHSYNKGGIVLHMLRNYIGDEAFFAALKLYLQKNAYTDVEVHELRLAFEEITGEDLNWFFNQWYLNAGHPTLEVTKEYDKVSGKVLLTIAQKQDADNNLPVYQLPVAVDIYVENGKKPMRFNVMTSRRKETFAFAVDKEPLLVNVDADRVLLCEMSYPKTREEYVFQYNNAALYLDRVEAIEGLQQLESQDDATRAVWLKAIGDPHFSIRGTAINFLDINDPVAGPLIEKASYTDAHSEVRAAAVFKMGQTGDKKYSEVLKKVLDSERAYAVISEALQSLYSLDKEAALKYIPKLENEESQNIVMALSIIYSENPTPQRVTFFEKKLGTVNGMDAIQFFNSYATMCSGLEDNVQETCIRNLQTIGTSAGDTPWRKYGAVKALSDMKVLYKALNNVQKTEEIGKIIEEIKSRESNPQLKAVYDQF